MSYAFSRGKGANRRWYVGYRNSAGKPVTKATVCETKRQAEEMAAALEEYAERLARIGTAPLSGHASDDEVTRRHYMGCRAIWAAGYLQGASAVAKAMEGPLSKLASFAQLPSAAAVRPLVNAARVALASAMSLAQREAKR